MPQCRWFGVRSDPSLPNQGLEISSLLSSAARIFIPLCILRCFEESIIADPYALNWCKYSLLMRVIPTINTNLYVGKASGITLRLLLWKDLTRGICLACLLRNNCRIWWTVHVIYILTIASAICYAHNYCTTAVECVHGWSFLI